MVTITINNQAICVSSAQAYALKLILEDYLNSHKVHHYDEEVFVQLDKMLRKATVFLHPLDMESIYKSTFYRDENGVIDHWKSVDFNDL